MAAAHLWNDCQIARHALEALLVGVVILPAPEVTDVTLVAMSAKSALLAVVRMCAGDPTMYFHDGEEDPHPDFWRFEEEIAVDGSDLIAIWDMSLPPLRNVMICWEDVAAEYPEIGDPPPPWREPSEPITAAGVAAAAAMQAEIDPPPWSSEEADGPQIRYARELIAAVFPSGKWKTVKTGVVRHDCEEAARKNPPSPGVQAVKKDRPFPGIDFFARAMRRRKPHQKPRK
jgi:hypothetical protein